MPHDEEVPAPLAPDRKRYSTSSQVDEPEQGSRPKRARTTPAHMGTSANSQADVKPSIAPLAANDGDERQRPRSSQGFKNKRQGTSGDIIDLTEGDVKREHSPIRLPAAHIGGVIDLTLEDD